MCCTIYDVKEYPEGLDENAKIKERHGYIYENEKDLITASCPAYGNERDPCRGDDFRGRSVPLQGRKGQALELPLYQVRYG